MRTLVIEKNALKNNTNVVKDAAGSSFIYANLSCDANGTGAVQLAHFLREEGIARFAVDDAKIAVSLRQTGLVEEEILMLRSVSDPNILETLLDHNIVCSVGNLEAGTALNALAESHATVAAAHLQLDCGLGFGGFPVEEPEKVYAVYNNLPHVAVCGVYTQVASRKGRGDSITQQLQAFSNAVSTIQKQGYETGIVHAAGSFALLHYDTSHLDAVRAGSVLLGRCRRSKNDALQLVGHGEAPISTIRWLPKGHTVGKDKQTVLRRPTRVAVIPVGYQNGFGVTPPVSFLRDAIRRFFKDRKRSVLINGQKARIIGSIGASETLLDVTAVKCTEGEIASFEIDPQFARGFRREYR